MISPIKSKLSRGEACHICWNTIANPQMAGLLAQQSFDGILMDAQHGSYSEETWLNSIPQVLLAGKSPLVRIPLDRWDLCQRALDFGAHGVVAPMINNANDAVNFVKSAKYPPIGSRSYGPTTTAAVNNSTSNDYVLAANEETLALAQIETLEAYENLDDILGVTGLDGVLMGPSDFAISVTGNPLPNPYGDETREMVADIAKRTNAVGKIAAAFTVNADHTKLVTGMGYQLISICFDTHLISNGSKQMFEAIKD